VVAAEEVVVVTGGAVVDVEDVLVVAESGEHAVNNVNDRAAAVTCLSCGRIGRSLRGIPSPS
jgi:hypothetical protein